MLNAEASAVARAQLVQEIQTLPECELQPRAIAILKPRTASRRMTPNLSRKLSLRGWPFQTRRLKRQQSLLLQAQ